MSANPSPPSPGESTRCQACDEPLDRDDAFCEACGQPTGTESVTEPAPPDAGAAPSPPTTTSCRLCQGSVEDGYCTVCGARGVTARDHWTEQPSPFVAGMCDRGQLHARNEDAMALAGVPDGSLAVLVVCDGVTSAPESDKAALAAARSACTHVIGVSRPAAGEAAIVAGWTDAIRQAGQVANASVVGVARTLGDPPEPPSCTFVAAIVDRGVIVVGWCGDSRALWLPDGGPAVALTLDHSLGTELIQSGKTPAEAEADPGFHTITRWLGADSVDATVEVASMRTAGPGWVVVCSDGLWNYASTPLAFAAAVERAAEHASNGSDPAALVAHLVAFANEHGGHDNITAAAARVDGSLR